MPGELLSGDEKFSQEQKMILRHEFSIIIASLIFICGTYNLKQIILPFIGIFEPAAEDLNPKVNRISCYQNVTTHLLKWIKMDINRCK